MSQFKLVLLCNKLPLIPATNPPLTIEFSLIVALYENYFDQDDDFIETQNEPQPVLVVIGFVLFRGEK